jgi:hypothetical protein
MTPVVSKSQMVIKKQGIRVFSFLSS